MELFGFCLEIIKREGERFNVSVNTSIASQITAATAADVNYDIAHNRCSFLYRCGTINLCFAKDCFSKFVSEYKSMGTLLLKWTNCPDLTMCSISEGPALDGIALLLSLHKDSHMLPMLFQNINIIRKYGAWRNTANIMHEIIAEGYLKSLFSLSVGNMKVIQGDPFKGLTSKIIDPISNSDVIIMMKALNMIADGSLSPEDVKFLQEFLGAVKTGAILFCIDTKPSVKEITQLLCALPGKFLFEPTHMSTSINLENTDLYKTFFGCLPVLSSRGNFFVWQKSSAPSPGLDECLVNVGKEYFTAMTADKCSKNDNGLICTNFEKSGNITSYFEYQSSNQQMSNCGNSYLYNMRQSPSLLQNEFSPASSFIKLESEGVSLDSSGAIFNTSTADVSIQTDQEKVSKRTEANKIQELNIRIANLTTELAELLETCTSKHTNNECLKCLEESSNSSVLNHDCHSHCSSQVACLHKCISPCASSCRVCNCQNHVCREFCSSSDQYNSNISLNDSEIHKGCKSSNNASSVFAAENTPSLSSVPQLIIPLTNLSTDVVTQIISLLNQSNSEEENKHMIQKKVD